jgi:UDP-N-acetylglucosamine--N-acetylmuramyl-(pentapeptide) pyrophosphoryl-undecaprenol N-acetylglucosamine transferase
MSALPAHRIRVAIACGGTGGHLFPGMAVGEHLRDHGCDVALMISPKEVDQAAVKSVKGMEVFTLPAVGLTRGRMVAFVCGFLGSYRASSRLFKKNPPQVALAMGGFTSAPPILAARRFGARTFLHESNSIPGRANRWLSWVVDQAFVGFPNAAAALHSRGVTLTGTPVRSQFLPREASGCRTALGLSSSQPVILVMGGSQGASGINELVMRSLPALAKLAPEWQWFHLAGPADAPRVRKAYEAVNLRAVVHPFFDSMELALGAATACISRAGASSLAELSAVRLPAVLIPYPAATDNHQFHNAKAFAQTGAAHLLEQKTATPETLIGLLEDLVRDNAARERMREALAGWHRPEAAKQIAAAMLGLAGTTAMELGRKSKGRNLQQTCSCPL